VTAEENIEHHWQLREYPRRLAHDFPAEDTRTPVLISGETAMEKSLRPAQFTSADPWQKTPFVAVDCGSLVPTLMESELFGYEKGALHRRDEIEGGLFQSRMEGRFSWTRSENCAGDAGGNYYAYWQEKEVRPVGSNEKISVDVRVIAATNRDLEAFIAPEPFERTCIFD